MNARYTAYEKTYGLLMVAIIIWATIVILLQLGNTFIDPAGLFKLSKLSDLFWTLVLFAPIALICLAVGTPTWLIAQKYGFESKTSAAIFGASAMLLVLFAFTGFNFSAIQNLMTKAGLKTTASFALFGATSGLFARIFAERARIRNGW